MTAPAPLDLPALLDDLERAHAAATRGEWYVAPSGGIDAGDYDTVIGRGDVNCMAHCYGGTSTIEGDNLAADLALIVAEHNAVPTLIAELRKRDAAEQLREFAEWVVSLDDDDPESPGRVHRRTVTLTEIVGRAAAALSPESVTT